MQTFIRLVVPLTTARTRWMFGFQRRFVRRCDSLPRTPVGKLSKKELIVEELAKRRPADKPARDVA